MGINCTIEFTILMYYFNVLLNLPSLYFLRRMQKFPEGVQLSQGGGRGGAQFLQGVRTPTRSGYGAWNFMLCCKV